MTRRDWWLGLAFVVLALLAHAAFPRYDWRVSPTGAAVRIDRWRGVAERVHLGPDTPALVHSDPLER